MSGADIFDTAVAVFRAYPLTLAASGLLALMPILLVPLCGMLGAVPLLALSGHVGSSSQLGGTLGATTLCVTAFAITIGAVGALIQSAAVADLTAQVLHGHAPSLRLTYGRAFRHGKSLLGAAVLIFGANAAAGLSGVVPCLGLPIGLAVQSVLNALFGFVWQAVAIEQLGSVDALRRSAQLARPTFIRVIGVQLAAGLLVVSLGIGPGLLTLSLLSFLPPWIPVILLGALAILIGAISTPFPLVVGTVLYYDLRMRQEGYDLQLQAEQSLGERAGA